MVESATVADGGRSALYSSLEASLLRELQKRLDSGEATASELATAAALLGKAGTPARSAGAGAVGSEESAVLKWLEGLPEQDQARMLAELKRQVKGSPLAPMRAKRRPVGGAGGGNAGELGDAA